MEEQRFNLLIQGHVFVCIGIVMNTWSFFQNSELYLLFTLAPHFLKDHTSCRKCAVVEKSSRACKIWKVDRIKTDRKGEFISNKEKKESVFGKLTGFFFF
jgi:hypothetical protein